MGRKVRQSKTRREYYFLSVVSTISVFTIARRLHAGEKAVKATTAGAHLYNLKQDLGEQTNLADKEPAKLQELAALWDQWNAGNIDAKWTPNRGGGGKKRKAQ